MVAWTRIDQLHCVMNVTAKVCAGVFQKVVRIIDASLEFTCLSLIIDANRNNGNLGTSKVVGHGCVFFFIQVGSRFFHVGL
jgi:hypothetical protein